MSGFLYFADGIRNPMTDELVSQLDLRYAFDGIPMHGPIDGRTPSGGPGTIMCEQSRLEPYDPVYRGDEYQVWRKRPGDDCVWIGYWRDSPPTPADLARHKQLAGDGVELGGHAWKIPQFWWHAEEDGFQPKLPRYFDLSDKGEWIYGDIDEAHAHLKPLADRLLAAIYFSGSDPSVPPLTTIELLETAPQLLAINYVVSPVECVMLKLFKKDGALRRMAELAVDYDTAMEWVKKKELAVAG
jgi:hypothetical protein